RTFAAPGSRASTMARNTHSCGKTWVGWNWRSSLPRVHCCVWVRRDRRARSTITVVGGLFQVGAGSVRGLWRGVVDVRRMRAHVRRSGPGLPTALYENLLDSGDPSLIWGPAAVTC